MTNQHPIGFGLYVLYFNSSLYQLWSVTRWRVSTSCFWRGKKVNKMFWVLTFINSSFINAFYKNKVLQLIVSNTFDSWRSPPPETTPSQAHSDWRTARSIFLMDRDGWPAIRSPLWVAMATKCRAAGRPDRWVKCPSGREIGTVD